MFQSDCCGSSSSSRKHDMWITIYSRQDLCPHQTGLFIESDSVRGRQRSVFSTFTVRLTAARLCCVHTAGSLLCTHTCTRRSFITSLNVAKERDITICPSPLGINVRYRSILQSIGSHYLSPVTYLNCYGSDCFQSPGRLRVSPRSSIIGQEKRRRLLSPNKDISPPTKSMLTVCLHRLGILPHYDFSSDTWWGEGRLAFEQRIVVWAGLIWLCLHFICQHWWKRFWSALRIVTPAVNPLRWKIHAFHIPVPINLCNCFIKMREDYIFFVDWTGYWQDVYNENRRWLRK